MLKPARATYPASKSLPAPRTGPGPADALFSIVVLGLVCFGLVMLLSASMSEGLSKDDQPLFFFAKQFLFTLIGAAICFFLSLQNPRRLDRPVFGLLLYGFATLLLVAVLVPGIGSVSGGARRWFAFGGFQVQPSEIAKFLLVFCLATYFSWVERKRSQGGLERRTPFRTFAVGIWFEFFLPIVLLAFWILPIAMEPHMSGIVILTLLAATLLCVSGARPRFLLAGLAILLVIALLLGLLAVALLPSLMPVLPDSLKKYTDLAYVTGRIDIFLHPEKVSSDQKWQTTQAVQAIGAGGLTGVGLGMGRQKYGYLPMSYNDYIFAIIGEELGLLGALLVLALFLVLLVRGTTIARRSGSTFGHVLATGYTVLLVLQALLNIGVATNSIPPTGISLPFFSYGGSSNLIFLSSVGVVLAVSRTAKSKLPVPGKEVAR
jgi:cell division protein FtsW